MKRLAILTGVILLAGCATKPKHVVIDDIPKTLHEAIQRRDGTNYIGVYLGMIAEHDGQGRVMMYSDTSGEWLKWISYQDFLDIFINKTKPEYSTSK
jgi:hypothetical protein